MQQRSKAGRTVAVAIALLWLAACSEREPGQPSESAAAPAKMAAAGRGRAEHLGIAQASPSTEQDTSQRRYVAVRHDISLFSAAEAVEPAWQQAQEACAAAGCELLAASVTRDEQRRPSQASLQARIPPQAVEAFLARVATLGSIGQHSRNADDKTDEVIDTEARLTNLTAFRDRLRTLLGAPGARLKDVIEVERELVRVQSEIDSLTNRRKALAQQTDWVHVSMTFEAFPGVLQTGIWAPVRDAVLNAGHGFSRSMANIIALAVLLLPWALIGFAAFAGWRWVRRRRRERRGT